MATATRTSPHPPRLRSALLGIAAALIGLILPVSAHAASGCTLAEPSRDLARFFPQMTDYEVVYLTFAVQAPDRWETFVSRLGGEVDPLFETPDVPFALYTVHGDGRVLGHVFGTNQRGRYSSLQVIAIADARARVRDIFLQRIRSPAHAAFTDPAYLRALAAPGLDAWAAASDCWADGACADVAVSDPTDGAEAEDHRAILRALAKLDAVRDLLLRPTDPLPPRDASAVAERLATWWMSEPVGTALPSPRWVPIDDVDLPEDTAVVLLRDTTPPRAVPLSVLALHPVIPDPEGVTVLSAPGWHVTHLRPDTPVTSTASSLFGVRTVLDPATGSNWSLWTGTALDGPRHGDRWSRDPVIRTRLSEVRRRLPNARVVLPADNDPDPASRLAAFTERFDGDVARASRRLRLGVHGIVDPEDTATLSTIRSGPSPVVLVRHPLGTAAFLAVLHGEPLDLVLVDDPRAPLLRDRASGAVWDAITGQGGGLPLGDPNLPLVPVDHVPRGAPVVR